MQKISESRLVLTQDGEVWESRFEGERELVEGVRPVMDISEGLVWLRESSRESEESWLDGPRGFGEVEIGDASE